MSEIIGKLIGGSMSYTYEWCRNYWEKDIDMPGYYSVIGVRTEDWKIDFTIYFTMDMTWPIL